MGFVLHGLDTESYDRTYSDRELIGRIVGYFRPHARQMAWVALLLTLNSVTSTGGPILISQAIDIAGQDDSLRTVGLLAGAVLALGIAAWTMNYVRQMVSARVVGDVIVKLRDDVFAATVQHDLSFFDE